VGGIWDSLCGRLHIRTRHFRVEQPTAPLIDCGNRFLYRRTDHGSPIVPLNLYSMKNLAYIIIGTFLGIVLYKSEAASWFRIYEMFQFDSFHMYGIIGSALAVGIVLVQWIKKSKVKS